MCETPQQEAFTKTLARATELVQKGVPDEAYDLLRELFLAQGLAKHWQPPPQMPPGWPQAPMGVEMPGQPAPMPPGWPLGQSPQQPPPQPATFFMEPIRPISLSEFESALEVEAIIRKLSAVQDVKIRLTLVGETRVAIIDLDVDASVFTDDGENCNPALNDKVCEIFSSVLRPWDAASVWQVAIHQRLVSKAVVNADAGH